MFFIRKTSTFISMEFKNKTFDQLTTKELYEILKSREAVFIVEQDCIYHDIDDKDEMSIHLFYEEKGRVVAYLRIVPAGIRFQEVSIGRVITLESHRRQGLSSKLMVKALDYIKEELEENVVRISAQAYLQRFYESLGFEKVSDVYLEDGIDHYEMLYSLGEHYGNNRNFSS